MVCTACRVLIRHLPNKRLVTHSRSDIDTYLATLGRQIKLKDWQFAQHIEAIRILFSLVNSTLAKDVDWTDWKSSSMSITQEHPTLTREAVVTTLG